jgi:hypothetical protein
MTPDNGSIKSITVPVPYQCWADLKREAHDLSVATGKTVTLQAYAKECLCTGREAAYDAILQRQGEACVAPTGDDAPA